MPSSDANQPGSPERRPRSPGGDDEGDAFDEFWGGTNDSARAGRRRLPGRRARAGGQPEQPLTPGGPAQPPRGVPGTGPVSGSTPSYGGDRRLATSDPSRAAWQPGEPVVPGPAAGGQPAAPYAGDTYTGDRYTDETYDEGVYYEDDYDEYEEYDDGEGLLRRRGCRAVLVALAVLVVAAGIAAWFGWSWVQRQIDPPGEPGETVLVEIPEQASTGDIGRHLADAGVITNAGVWDWYIRFRTTPQFQAGRYEMQLNSSYGEAIEALRAGALPPDAILITVPEGYTVAETLARLADPDDGVQGFTAENLLMALADPESRSAVIPEGQPSLEGTLLPESYQVEEADTEVVVIQRMVSEFDDLLLELDLEGGAGALGYSPYEVLIVASMIEEEARVDAERAQVARVIYNRLAEEMPLQIDATSCYAKAEPGCTLTESDLASDSPYNTRNRQGLPPTPIASPGRASLEAALAPASGDWLYYVLDAEADDGSHVFTADYDEFIQARRRCAEAGLGCG